MAERQQIMYEVKIFENKDFGSMRTIEIDGEPWFVLADICKVLEIANSRNVTARLDPDEKGVRQVDTLGGKQEMTIINESGLYNVILRSDKPQAKPFRKWVTSEVLPSIRKHGAYMTEQTIEKALANPDFLIQLATQLKAEKEKNKDLQAKVSALTVGNQIMQPKADYFDELVDRNLLTGIRETAKELKIKQKVFVDFLLDKKYLYRDKKGKLTPYAKHAETGIFELKEFTNDKTGFSSVQTLATPKGRETFRLLLLGA